MLYVTESPDGRFLAAPSQVQAKAQRRQLKIRPQHTRVFETPKNKAEIISLIEKL